MPLEIKTITLRGVNCYLIKIGDVFILIDTGFPNKRTDLEKELESAGCKPGNLKLVVITHGDFDHTGNCAYLREKYGTKIAMHRSESEVVERGDMLLGRKDRHILARMIFRLMFRIILAFMRLGRFDKFKPDLYIEDGYDLSEYGFDAKILHIPGHSKGSIGILTIGGDLFCGDLLTNRDKPALNSIMDDPEAANTSVEKLKSLKINTVYPGHGKQFPMERFIINHRKK